MVKGNGRKKRATLKVPEGRSSVRTIGVRFLSGNDIQKVYTYKVPSTAKVYLGQELVADTPRGPAVAAIVRLDKTPLLDVINDDGDTVEVKSIERKVVPL